MGDDVPTDRFLSVSGEHSSTIDLCDNLVGDDDSYPELIGNPLKGAQEFGQ